MTASKLVLNASSGVGGAGLDVDEVFSTFVYDGNSSSNTATTQQITNNIDLTEGGLVWIKRRDGSTHHGLVDTERGGTKELSSSSSSAQNTADSSQNIAFNTDGFTMTGWYLYNATINKSGEEYVSWTFRKAPKFFDVVTYSGTGSAQNISHNLGSVPGMIIIKGTDIAENWIVYHRSLGETKYVQLNSTGAAGTSSIAWNDTAPTSTQFTVNTFNAVNESGYNYVAYLFAHNNSDGEFGPDSDQDIIKCGFYSGSSSVGNFVNLGFEPQFILIKNASSSGEDWLMFDTMRGISTGSGDFPLYANTNSSTVSIGEVIQCEANGFSLMHSSWGGINQSGSDYIYMAIRRGPLAAPEDATKVFAVKASTNGSGTLPLDIIPTIGFAPDWGFVIRNIINGSRGGTLPYIGTRLTGYGKSLLTDRTSTEGTATIYDFATSDAPLVGDAGGANDSGAQNIHWLWKRAPSFCDVVCYTGDGTSSNSTRTAAIPHNLGVQPEMAWIKRRDSTSEWVVAHKDYGAGYLNLTNSFSTYPIGGVNHNDAFTATNFKIGTWQQEANFNYSGATYIAYLFASADGVAKVGSYTGNGSSQNIDCGFSSGARFVLIKNVSADDNWMVYDSVRGIVSGNDPYLRINTALAEYTTGDHIDPYSSGFAATSNDPSTNKSGDTYIFYAIA